MRTPVQTSIAILMVAILLIAGSLICIPSAQAEGSDPELVPEPWVHETHEFNVQENGPNMENVITHEKWSIEVRHGDVMTLIMARNLSQDNERSVDYTMNVHYDIGGTLYIAQFMIVYATFAIGDQTINAPLTTCDDFEVTYTPVQYDGAVPTFDCAISYKNIQVYPDASRDSTFDLTLYHHIYADWNRTDIKVEAQFDFNNTKFYNGSTDAEFEAGEPFTAEIHYMMMLGDPTVFSTEGPLIPTGHTDTGLDYNLTQDNGLPMTISKLNMSNEFTVFNGTSSYASMGYSSTNFGGQSFVTHGFPGLIYKDTRSMESDPEISVFHDRVTDNQINGTNNPNGFPLWIALVAIAVIAATAVAILMVKKKKRA